MTWLPNGSLRCDTCTATVEYGKTDAETIDRALARGWGVFTGSTQGGTSVTLVSCRVCRRTERKRPLKPVQGFVDTPLFEE